MKSPQSPIASLRFTLNPSPAPSAAHRTGAACRPVTFSRAPPNSEVVPAGEGGEAAARKTIHAKVQFGWMQDHKIGHTNPGSRILTSFVAMGYGPSTGKSGSASSSPMTHRRACPGSFPAAMPTQSDLSEETGDEGTCGAVVGAARQVARGRRRDPGPPG